MSHEIELLERKKYKQMKGNSQEGGFICQTICKFHSTVLKFENKHLKSLFCTLQIFWCKYANVSRAEAYLEPYNSHKTTRTPQDETIRLKNTVENQLQKVFLQ